MKDDNYQAILYANGGGDERYTPNYVVKCILEYIPKQAVVWCPFDTGESEFVKEIGKTNKVIYSHISCGEDFHNYEPVEHWDVIISNPPFNGKREIFERALSFNKPFALLMSNTWLNDAAPIKLFMEKDLQLLMFDKRISYIDSNGDTLGRPSFSSSYYCYNFLPKQIIMKAINNKL